VDVDSPPASWQIAFPDGEEPIQVTGNALTIEDVH
jgi:hypothetical protein